MKNLNDVIHGDRAIVRGSRSLTKDELEDGKVLPFGGRTTAFERCYQKHPPLPLPGTDLVIYGGSCIDPAVKDADVYIGFDSGMRFTERVFPWKKGDEFLFRIPDMGVPQKPEEFKKMVSWTRKQLEAGRKVHCGCIGGHGRTGTFFAALVSTFGEQDAIGYVRKHYCPKAVESTSQVNFLVEHFGVKAADGYKSKGYSTSSKKGLHSGSVYSKSSGGSGRADPDRFVCTPMAGYGSIW